MEQLLTVLTLAVGIILGIWAGFKFEKLYVALLVSMGLTIVINFTIVLIFFGFGWIS